MDTLIFFVFAFILITSEIYVCKRAHFKGRCTWFMTTPDGSDSTAVSSSEWYGNIGAFGPDQGTVCMIYDGSRCTKSNFEVKYPCIPDMLGPGVDDWQ